MEKLKQRWGIERNYEVIVILIVFSITGSLSVKLASPILAFFNITKESVGYGYWPIRIFMIFPVYQVLLVCIGTLFGQHKFFWNFEKKMLSRFGIKL